MSELLGRGERPLTGEFWAAVDRRELVRPVCAGCGRSHFTPQVVCPHCQSSDWTYQPSSGLGTVYSHTTIHRPPDPSFEAPYTLAIVDLDEGWSMLSWLIDSPAPVIGQRVAVTFVPGADGELLPAFAPEGDDEVAAA